MPWWCRTVEEPRPRRGGAVPWRSRARAVVTRPGCAGPWCHAVEELWCNTIEEPRREEPWCRAIEELCPCRGAALWRKKGGAKLRLHGWERESCCCSS
jgi:hypothetical protein